MVGCSIGMLVCFLFVCLYSVSMYLSVGRSIGLVGWLIGCVIDWHVNLVCGLLVTWWLVGFFRLFDYVCLCVCVCLFAGWL